MGSGEFDGMVTALSRSGLAEDHIAEMVDVVSELGDASRRLRAFPKGQFGPDGIEVHTVFELSGLESLMRLLSQNARIDSVEIFPRGIINPEVFSARIGLR
ncbi:MAG: hypothetical protein QOD69_1393 [Solirubrobacteraceae bacterium]|jgi:hypothetical protein|nr:hypothetical protein [Solirubrobacteraceae bacterium]